MSTTTATRALLCSGLLRPAAGAQRVIKAGARWVSHSAPVSYATHTDSDAPSAGDRLPAAAKPLMKEFKIYRWVC
jgi:hypothetical protein